MCLLGQKYYFLWKQVFFGENMVFGETWFLVKHGFCENMVFTGEPMRGLEMIMWSEGQWEASQLIITGGDIPHTYKHCDSMTDPAQSINQFYSRNANQLGQLDYIARQFSGALGPI